MEVLQSHNKWLEEELSAKTDAVQQERRSVASQVWPPSLPVLADQVIAPYRCATDVPCIYWQNDKAITLLSV